MVLCCRSVDPSLLVYIVFSIKETVYISKIQFLAEVVLVSLGNNEKQETFIYFWIPAALFVLCGYFAIFYDGCCRDTTIFRLFSE